LCLELPNNLESQIIVGNIRQLIEVFEKQFSRFRSDSELSLFNNSKDEFVASPQFIKLLKTSQKYYNGTDGIYNPAIYPLLNKYYDKTFDRLDTNICQPNNLQQKIVTANLDSLKIRGHRVQKDPQLQIDFGGIGKGFLADIVAKEVSQYTINFFLSFGGDILVSGKSGTDDWKIGVENPIYIERDILTIRTKANQLAIATSGVIHRHGIVNGIKWNHLIDPRTQEPVKNDILTVTVLANNVTDADVWAKTVLILGEEAGFEFINHQNGAAIIIKHDVSIIKSANVDKFGIMDEKT
jgi:thiamine biosynthesis lipoprotein